jgi:tetratricopeptide (TPR) repeat protein
VRSKERGFFRLFVFLVPLLLFSCAGAPVSTAPSEEGPSDQSTAPDGSVKPAEAPAQAQPAVERPAARTAGVADEIRSLVEAGGPGSLLQALDMIRSRGLESGEFGRAMIAAVVHLMKRLYPGVGAQLSPADPPQTHAFTRIFREVERANYVSPAASVRDYLELVLPFLALLQETRPERFQNIEADLLKARGINAESVLAPYFLGLLYERTGRQNEAVALYEETARLSEDCYPASMGIARILEARGQRAEAIARLSALVVLYPDNQQVKRQLAASYYRARDWSHAESAITEVLQWDGRDGPMILARAHALVEQGKYLQAQAPLDTYGTIDPYNRLYLFLRARVQDRGYRNRDAALNYLRSILRTNPNDDEAAVYAAQLLLESSRAEDQKEGRELLARLLEREAPSPEMRNLAVQEAIHREAWREAQTLLAPLLQSRRSAADLLNSYTVERGLGNNAAALQAARELYERESANEDGIIAYISALIDTGRQTEAKRLVDARVNTAPGGTVKARYYYLRSRLGASDDQIIADLRSSLFEDPRNLDSLIDIVEVYHRRKDERRVVYYLRLALAIAPDNARLRRWETEYASLLGTGL